jgi:hypothetical protein
MQFLLRNRVAGFAGSVISPEWFLAEQVASPLQDITQGSKMVTYQLGNLFFLLAMIGIAVLYTTTEARVVRNYMVALAIADIGHVAITCYVMEYEKTVDIANWNSMAWGNIGATVSNINLIAELSCRLICILDVPLLRSFGILVRPLWARSATSHSKTGEQVALIIFE